MQFNKEVKSAIWDEDQTKWLVTTAQGEVFTATYLISGVGCLSTSSIPNFQGRESFKGRAITQGIGHIHQST